MAIMRQFYSAVLGLAILSGSDERTQLGEGSMPLVELQVEKSPRIPQPGEAGLYHVALLYPTPADLAARVKHVISAVPQYFRGSADHLVSEAFYFTDPEGNGIELYTDRDPKLWVWENGSVQMASEYIDPQVYIRSYSDWPKSTLGARMGHVHLKVGDIQKAEDFYHRLLGFDVTAKLPGALFVSKGGYHHHIGLNTWESQGAGARQGNIGLASFEIILHDPLEGGRLATRLKEAAFPYSQEGSQLVLHDPWRNRIIVSVSEKSNE
jgi:catechol 2,3-dioxygenase